MTKKDKLSLKKTVHLLIINLNINRLMRVELILALINHCILIYRESKKGSLMRSSI